MSVNLWNSSSRKWKNDGLPAVIVDNLQKSQKTGKNPLALAIWICYNYEAVLAEQDIWLKTPYYIINVT